jgi:hypothetical protein
MVAMSRLCVLLAVVIAFVFAEPWNAPNDPALFSAKYQHQFSQLPLLAHLPKENIPWSDDYWASRKGGIAHRWHFVEENRSYSLHTRESVFNMTHEQLMTLSPAEKFDILNSRYDFPTVQSERQRTSPDDAAWEGLCHGWAPAAIAYKQPVARNLTNIDGITIPFGSSDSKAMLTYFAAEYQPESVENVFVGTRCEEDLQRTPERADVVPECADTNAATFHIILTNEIGLRQKSFVVDVDRSYPVWNQPVAGYNATIVETVNLNVTNITQEGTPVREHLMHTKIQYVKETWPSYADHDPFIMEALIQYWLQVDSKDNIVGGRYVAYERMDFLWNLIPSKFSGYYSTLHMLVDGHMPDADMVETSSFKNANAVTMNHVEGSIEERVTKGRTNKTWKIQVTKARKITFKFNAVATKRFSDRIRIYEGEGGPLIASVHGHSIPADIHVESSTAYVVFNTQGQFPASFKLFYSAQ